MNDILAEIVCGIFILWWILYLPIEELVRKFYANILFNNRQCVYFTKIYDLLYNKKYIKNDSMFISRLKVSINTHIEKFKNTNNSSWDSIVTIFITVIMTMNVATYTIEAQLSAQKLDSLMSIIKKGMSEDFATIFFIILILYGIRMVFRGISYMRLKYYIMIKNILTEVENNKPIKINYYTSYIKNEI